MIGNRLKYLREKKGLTQKQLASALGIAQSHISAVESDTKQPGAEILISLKKFFGVDLNWFLTGEGLISEEPPEYHAKDPVTDLIDRVLEEMDEDGKRDVLKYAEEKKLLAELRAERQINKL